MKQRTSEWFEMTKEYTDYQAKQLRKTYRSTVLFCRWLEKLKKLNKYSKLNIIDVGSGQGGNIYYMGKRYKKCCFLGIDFNPHLVNLGNSVLKKSKLTNCSLKLGNIYSLDKKYKNRFDGLLSFQTLSWLPDFREPLKNMASLRPKWIAFSSLFYDGPVNALIQIQDYSSPLKNKPYTQRYYNVYSLPLVKELLESYGYKTFKFVPFEIDVDLLPPKSKGMGTYTLRLNKGNRIQLSGPLLMNWYFVFAER